MPRRYLPSVGKHRAWAEIDLGAFGHNLTRIQERAGPNTEVILVVKADGYGHGALPLALEARRLGVDSFGVGTAEEALELRRGGLLGRILLLGTIVDDEAETVLREGIELGVHSLDRCQKLSQLATRLGLVAGVHLNVDTGMGRLGVLPQKAFELLRAIHAAPGLQLAGLMSHVAAPSGAREAGAHEQARLFEAVAAQARQHGLLRGILHLSNSAALFTDLAPGYDAVRPGIAAYGMLPEELLVGGIELRPVLSLRAQVIFFKDLDAGTPVGYGGTWVAHRRSRIATLPVGYNDGVPWRLGNRGRVLVRGRSAPIVGRVSMDYLTIDITDVPGVEVGDTATLIGADGEDRIRAEDLARLADTIPYEITCSIGRRVPRQVLAAAASVAEAPAEPEVELRPAPPIGGAPRSAGAAEGARFGGG